MKKSLLFSILILSLTINAVLAQWAATTSQSIPGFYRIDAIKFINGTVGFAGGSTALFSGNGVISKTSNGGSSWSTVATFPSSPVENIYFVNSSLGFAVGTKGLIAKTTNGGNTWTFQNYTNPNTLSQESLSKVQFLDQNLGYIVGGFNATTVLKTIDGGTTWNLLTIPSGYSQRLKALYFFDPDNGLVVGGDQFGGGFGKICRTNDGGVNWDTLPSGVKDYFNDIVFLDANNGLIGCAIDGKILKTTDGGLNWFQVTNPAGTSAINEFSFIDSSTGYACTLGGKIIKTTNGGDSWAVDGDVSSLISSLYSISVFSSSIGFSVGLGGLYAKLNGGTNTNDSFSENLNLKIFPNPFTSHAYFQSDNILENVTMIIFNSFGQVEIKITNFCGNSVLLQRGNLNSGIYFLQLIKDDKIMRTSKFIIE